MIKLSAPISVVWEITNNCNYKCPHCRAYQMYHKEDKNIEDAIIKQLIDSKVMYVNISGGEPLLNPRIFDIAKRLANENIYLALSTNGYFYLKYRKNIVDSGIKFVQVSLDGKKELHEKFRGVKGSYEKAIEALKMAKADGLRTQMNVTITSSNINNLEWNYNIAKEIHVDKVFYRRVVPYGKAKTNKYVLPEKKLYYEQIRKLSKLDSKDLQVSIDSIADKLDKPDIPSETSVVTVTSTGTVGTKKLVEFATTTIIYTAVTIPWANVEATNGFTDTVRQIGSIYEHSLYIRLTYEDWNAEVFLTVISTDSSQITSSTALGTLLGSTYYHEASGTIHQNDGNNFYLGQIQNISHNGVKALIRN